jgi:hypothetical protein
MGNGSELKSAGAKALRAAGFVPLPRLWVKRRDLEQIKIFAKQYEAEVNAIRAEANSKENRNGTSNDT